MATSSTLSGRSADGGLPRLLPALIGLLRSTRCGDAGQPTSNSSVSAGRESACTGALCTGGWASDTSLAQIGAHDDSEGAGSERGAAPRPDADPPAASTGKRHGPSHDSAEQRAAAHDTLYHDRRLDTLGHQRSAPASAALARLSPSRPVQHRAPRPGARDQLRTKARRGTTRSAHAPQEPPRAACPAQNRARDLRRTADPLSAD